MTITIHPPAADIFATTCAAIVIPTNCLGINGAGLAKLAARRWPNWDRAYAEHCKAGRMKPGCTWFLDMDQRRGSQWVVALTTKDDWRSPSRIEWVAAGLDELRFPMPMGGIGSIAVPALGCGARTGQLAWGDVRPLILATAERLSARGVRVEVYPPHEERKGNR